MEETTPLIKLYSLVSYLLFILIVGPDPADTSRILVRKLIKVSETTYCFEETRVTPGEKVPSVHT